MFHKNWPGGGELFLQNVLQMVTPTNHVIARAGFTLSWAHDTLDQKKSYMSAGPLALSHLLNPSLVIALRS